MGAASRMAAAAAQSIGPAIGRGEASAATDLRRLFDPRTIAVVGASEDPGRNVARSMQATMWAGFQGRILPVNPKYRTVFGHPCVADIADIREPVDIVMAFVGPDRLLDVYRACRGAGFFIAVGDIVPKGGPDADHLAREVLALARSGWPRIVGPQCVGIVSPETGAAATISTAVDETGLPRGPIGIVSQSGGIVSSLIERARILGGGFSHMVSSGGEFDLATPDYMRFLIEDPATRVIGIYAESVADYPALLATTARDLAPHLLPYYLREVAAAFHAYYAVERIRVDEPALRAARTALAAATAQVLKNGLQLLGVSAPERM